MINENIKWFESWFDSKYYHLLYKNRDNKEAKKFIDNLFNYLKPEKGSKIIDVGCGNGRHAKYFNKLGFNVTGIDLSKKSIEYAKKYENSSLQFHIHDMRNKFQKNNFDICTNLFTSFGYFETDEEHQKAINEMANIINNQGILIIDFMNVKKVINNLVRSEIKKVEEITFQINRKYEDNYIKKDISFFDEKKSFTFQERVQVITLIDFNKFISNSGLKIIDVFGNYDLTPFNAQESDTLILICKK